MQSDQTKNPADREDFFSQLQSTLKGDHKSLLKSALDNRTPPEDLVLLSQTNDQQIRTAVASNASSPAAIDIVMAEDDDPIVRAAIAMRFASLLPDVAADERDRFAERAHRVMSVLAIDSAASVRRILSEEICHLSSVPKNVVMTLAADVDALVAVPVCEFSPVLEDADLIELVATHGAAGDPSAALSAIARRHGLAADVADCLVATGNVVAIEALLCNRNAQIRESALDHIVERAPDEESWHPPLCSHPKISSSLALKLARFVANRFIEQLSAREDLDQTTIAQLNQRLAARLSNSPSSEATSQTPEPPTEFQILGAIGERRQSEVIRMLAERANVDTSTIKRIMATHEPKVIVALAWKTGLSIETAELLQSFPGDVHEKRLIKSSGFGFPISDNDMEWQLATFGIRNRS